MTKTLLAIVFMTIISSTAKVGNIFNIRIINKLDNGSQTKPLNAKRKIFQFSEFSLCRI
ncbi:hypothetical protein EZS27_025155 [termite gut metagenome]|uniref:Uncharacterized protein n=1 Tax=termite gut metagenome TaxID=433724 RepID=A0A5J4QX77_9ZZZZ